MYADIIIFISEIPMLDIRTRRRPTLVPTKSMLVLPELQSRHPVGTARRCIESTCKTIITATLLAHIVERVLPHSFEARAYVQAGRPDGAGWLDFLAAGNLLMALFA